MRPKPLFRVILMAMLVAALGVPPDARTAVGQQQGPQPPAPQRQPEPPTPPNGQSQRQAPPSQPPLPQVAISVQSNLVTVDAVVTDQDGNIVTGLKRQNFRVLDNGQPQQITNFAPTEAPITIVILMEFSKLFGGYFGYKAKDWSYGFLNQLKPQDWVALKTFDLKTTLVDDFTQDKREVGQAIAGLYFPSFSEANLFDALLETIGQLRDVKGKKSILLLATGFDTFSKHNLDDTLKRLKETDVTVFCVGMGEEIDLYSPGGAGLSYMQAKNQLSTFARETGGYAWFPRFEGEMPDIFNSVAAFLRNQYTLVFSPSTPQDGRFHKLSVQVVDDQGNPMELANKKGKKKKAVVIAREGYTAPNAPAAD
ncbi:MAG TPA: VWA domain-containing protein [Candidatus Acidoferrales bacterium]|nr:VWA domain-containing protein [Candidatus Acidoferrales bacterium]